MARSEKVSYWRGKHATIPNTRIPGRILMEEDTGDCFLEFNWYDEASNAWEVKRKQLTDTRKFGTSGGRFTGPVFLVDHPDNLIEQVESENASPEYLAATKYYVDKVNEDLNIHKSDDLRHISTRDGITSEREYWNSKVDSVEGKGLSTNDFTDDYLKKLKNISEGATKTYFEQIAKDGIEIGKIIIDSKQYSIYTPQVINIPGSAGSADTLKYSRCLDGLSFDGSQDIIRYGACTSQGLSTVKQVSIDNFVQKDGSSIYVAIQNKDEIPNEQNDETNEYDNTKVYIKVNENNPALPVKYRNEFLARGRLNKGIYHFVVYNSSFNIVGELDTDTNTTYEDATTDLSGLMSSQDKKLLDSMNTKLQGIADGANKYELHPATSQALGGVKIGSNITCDDDGTISITYDNISEAIGDNSIFSIFTEATDNAPGDSGLVPGPAREVDNAKFLRGDARWAYPDIISESEILSISKNIISLNSDFRTYLPNNTISLISENYTFYANKTYKYEFSRDDSGNQITLYFSSPQKIDMVRPETQSRIDNLLKDKYPEAVIATDAFRITYNLDGVTLNSAGPIGSTDSASLISETQYAVKIIDSFQSQNYIYVVLNPKVDIEFQSQQEGNYIHIPWSEIGENSVGFSTWVATSKTGEVLSQGRMSFNIVRDTSGRRANSIRINDNYKYITISDGDGNKITNAQCRCIETRIK